MNSSQFVGQEHRRWCAVCGTQRGTKSGKFIKHWKPNNKPDDPPCPNSGISVEAASLDAAGHNRQVKVG